MTDRNLTVARLVTDHIDAITVEDDAFGDLLSELGIAPKVERRATVTSEKAGDPETRTYFVLIHVVPAGDDTTRVYSCTCGAFKFHELLPHADEIRADPEAGSESLGRCKHADAVAVEDRTAENREAGQQGFEAYAEQDDNQ